MQRQLLRGTKSYKSSKSITVCENDRNFKEHGNLANYARLSRDPSAERYKSLGVGKRAASNDPVPRVYKEVSHGMAGRIIEKAALKNEYVPRDVVEGYNRQSRDHGLHAKVGGVRKALRGELLNQASRSRTPTTIYDRRSPKGDDDEFLKKLKRDLTNKMKSRISSMHSELQFDLLKSSPRSYESGNPFGRSIEDELNRMTRSCKAATSSSYNFQDSWREGEGCRHLETHSHLRQKMYDICENKVSVGVRPSNIVVESFLSPQLRKSHSEGSGAANRATLVQSRTEEDIPSSTPRATLSNRQVGRANTSENPFQVDRRLSRANTFSIAEAEPRAAELEDVASPNQMYKLYRATVSKKEGGEKSQDHDFASRKGSRLSGGEEDDKKTFSSSSSSSHFSSSHKKLSLQRQGSSNLSSQNLRRGDSNNTMEATSSVRSVLKNISAAELRSSRNYRKDLRQTDGINSTSQSSKRFSTSFYTKNTTNSHHLLGQPAAINKKSVELPRIPSSDSDHFSEKLKYFIEKYSATTSSSSSSTTNSTRTACSTSALTTNSTAVEHSGLSNTKRTMKRAGTTRMTSSRPAGGLVGSGGDSKIRSQWDPNRGRSREWSLKNYGTLNRYGY
eukprot:CAMPEP_0115021596 /NCGR_PEP_ID=MMETSP0216-20121206/30991_1 /TAXON_ID=223996 /ORGANISM="Protocruzia adherens, Strain Boccale" /LENGTH=617 /DNA_ID=CAMNT_0002394003 /DNA_START=212 /DNA_END=2065 /DNA_ORIENTATION=+